MAVHVADGGRPRVEASKIPQTPPVLPTPLPPTAVVIEAAEVVIGAAEATTTAAAAPLLTLDTLDLLTCPATNNEELPVGGHLALFQHQWHFSPWALSVISNGLGWKW